MESDQNITKEAVNFLERDFNQGYSQLRHYDNQIIGIFKFGFTSYATIIGIATGLYQFSQEKGINLIGTVKALICACFLIGIFMLWLIVRNRGYYVRIARYINEHRKFFLNNKPLGFENNVGMYTDINHPKYFNWKSSHLLYVYISAIVNGILLSVLIYMQLGFYKHILALSITSFFFSVMLQLIIIIKYLKGMNSKDKE